MFTISISSSNIFTSTAQIGRTNDANYDQENGIDSSIVQQWGEVGRAAALKPSNKGNEGLAMGRARLDFVNSLTPEQLKGNAGFTMGSDWGKGVYTWQTIKDYSNAVQGLVNKAMSLMKPDVDQSNDPTLSSIYDLIGGLNKNSPGALERATQYLAASNAADTVTLSTGAVSALATGSAAAALLKKELSSGGSASDSDASIALAMLKASESSEQETRTSAGDEVSGMDSGSVTSS